ncbi:MAG: sulfite exporter TauE/SafE family protein [Pikeienuella sp.]
METEIALLLFAAGLFAGVLNAVAGGATFFTFPALLLAGLPPLSANATNYMALIPSNITALPAYRRELLAEGRRLIFPLVLAALGGMAGAWLLLRLGGGLFEAAAPWMMGGATVLFATAPALRRAMEASGGGSGKVAGWSILSVMSVYGGYFGAGLGPITLAALTLMGRTSFQIANALKNAIISSISIGAIVVYGVSDAVSWPHAVVMMAGAALGGYVGGAMARYAPDRALRLFVTVFGAFLTIWYFVNGL